MEFTEYISSNSLVLIPVLYVLGLMIKQSETLKDKHIPLVLLMLGIAFSLLINGITVNAIIQAILVTGTTVYANQVVKQFNKKD